MDQNEHDSNPPSIPSYTPIRKIGRGSYGEVWIYRRDDGVPHAIKVVRKSSFETAKPYQRELAGLRRFAPVSKLHSSQLTVHQVIEAEDGSYFSCVMELADPAEPHSAFDPESYQPQTLRRRINETGELPPEQATIIAFQLATALKTLHDAGLIHRDIKPSNIIFVDGVPKLADIGLLTTLETTITSDVGTKSYMPPGEPNSIQSDIYSLGKTFYEMITGLPIGEFPKLPDGVLNKDNLNDILEFNEVVMKACAPRRGRRYKTLAPLIKDLSLVQSGTSIIKRRKRRTFFQRGALTASVAVVSLGLGILAQNAHTHRKSLDLRALEARVADRIHNNTLGQYYTSARELEQIKSRYPTLVNDPRIRRLENRIQHLPDVDPEPAQSFELPKKATNIQLSYLNNELHAAYNAHDDEVRVRNLTTQQSVLNLSKPNYNPTHLSWDASGHWLATLWKSTSQRHLEIYDIPTKKLERSLQLPEFWISDAILFRSSNDKLTYAYLSNSEHLHLIPLDSDTRSSIPLAAQNQTQFSGTNLSKSQTHNWIAVWNTNRFDVRILNPQKNSPSENKFQHTARVQSVTWAETAPMFTTATHDGALTIWEAPTGKRLAHSKITDEPITQTFALQYPDAQLSITQSGLPIYTQFSLVNGGQSNHEHPVTPTILFNNANSRALSIQRSNLFRFEQRPETSKVTYHRVRTRPTLTLNYQQGHTLTRHPIIIYNTRNELHAYAPDSGIKKTITLRDPIILSRPDHSERFFTIVTTREVIHFPIITIPTNPHNSRAVQIGPPLYSTRTINEIKGAHFNSDSDSFILRTKNRAFSTKTPTNIDETISLSNISESSQQLHSRTGAFTEAIPTIPKAIARPTTNAYYASDILLIGGPIKNPNEYLKEKLNESRYEIEQNPDSANHWLVFSDRLLMSGNIKDAYSAFLKTQMLAKNQTLNSPQRSILDTGLQECARKLDFNVSTDLGNDYESSFFSLFRSGHYNLESNSIHTARAELRSALDKSNTPSFSDSYFHRYLPCVLLLLFSAEYDSSTNIIDNHKKYLEVIELIDSIIKNDSSEFAYNDYLSCIHLASSVMQLATSHKISD